MLYEVITIEMKGLRMATQCTSNVDFKKVDEIIQSYGAKKSNVIAILQKVQETFRYLPEDAITYIGTKIEGLSPATVYGIATRNNFV